MSAQPAAHAESQNILEAIQEGFNARINQLTYALKRVQGDDLSVRYIEECINGLHLLATDLADIANADMNEHDQLVGLLNDRDLSISLVQNALDKANEELEILRARAANMEEDIADAIEQAMFEMNLTLEKFKGRISELEKQLTDKTNMLDVYAQRDRNQRNELKELTKLDPERLKRKNAEYQRQNKAHQATITDLNQKLNKERGEKGDLRSDNTLLMKALESERGEVARLESHIARANGISSGYRHESTLPTGQPLVYAIDRKFQGIYTLQEPDARPRYIDNLDFTYVIWASIGVGSAVRINEWLRPCYRRDELLKDHWPEDIYDALEDMTVQELETTHPHLLKRVAWAKGIHLDEIEGISETARKALRAENHSNLRDIVMFDAEELALTKGIGAKTAEQILSVCNRLVDEWDRQNGAPVIGPGQEPI